MSATPATFSLDGQGILFRLLDGHRPLVYADAATRISYDLDRNVVHVGVVWGMRYHDGLPAMELEDGTVVAIEDIDPGSVVLNPTLAHADGQAPE